MEPARSVEMPAVTDTFSTDDQGRLAVRPDDAKAADVGSEGGREVAGGPGLRPRHPAACLAHLLVADDHVQVAVAIQVEQAHAVVAAVGGAERLPAEYVLRQPLHRLAE